MSYSNGIQTTHHFTIADQSATTIEVALPTLGPGLTGRVAAMSFLVTTVNTGAASNLTVGTNADPDGFASLNIGAAAADQSIWNTVVDGVLGNRITADSEFEIGFDGAATTGVGEASIVIEWS